MRALRRWRPLILLVTIWLLFMYWLLDDAGSSSSSSSQYASYPASRPGSGHHGHSDGEDLFREGPAENGGELNAKRWRKLPDRYPVDHPRSLPDIIPGAKSIPRIQKMPPPEEKADAKALRLKRQAAVKESFLHSWQGYKKYAWLSDEVRPLTGKASNPFGGWAATLVDALDTLWIMGLTDEFEAAVKAAEGINFFYTKQDRINVFETTIRYLGGFLAAYELSEEKYPALLKKAIEVGDLVLCAFDTANHMPIARWDWKYYMTGHAQVHHKASIVSELGSLTLEFTKLSQLTGDMRYYDAVQRISDHFEQSQESTKLPGLWPITVDVTPPLGPSFTADNSFTIGGMADSLYEYFPKQYLLLGGALEQPRKMYERFVDVAKKAMFRRVANPENIPIIFPGDVKIKVFDVGSEISYITKGQHLSCFVGGMLGIASKIFNRPEELDLAIQATDGCVWAYNATTTGMMPEIFRFLPCGGIEEDQTGSKCAYSELNWRNAVREYYSGDTPLGDAMGDEVTRIIETRRLVPGIVEMSDRKYILRPEAIESVFLMYRMTGDATWMDKAWTMFEAVEKYTRSSVAAASLKDVMTPGGDQADSMESFWLAETLKYFYLVFSEFDLVDLDTWVLNTEAHPLHRPDVA